MFSRPFIPSFFFHFFLLLFFSIRKTIPESAKAIRKLPWNWKPSGNWMDIIHTTSEICFGSVSWDLVLEIFIIPSQRYISLNRILTSFEDNKPIRDIRRSSPARREVTCSAQNAYCWKTSSKENHYKGLLCDACEGNIYKYLSDILLRSSTGREIFSQLFQGKIFHLTKLPGLWLVITMLMKEIRFLKTLQNIYFRFWD